MTTQWGAGVPAHVVAELGGEAEANIDVSHVTERLLTDLGLDLELEPRAFLRTFFAANGRSIADDEINLILDQYTVVPYVGADDGGADGSAPSVGRLADGRRIEVVRKMNRNRKLEALNMTGGLIEAADETKRFKDAAGLGDVVAPEKMNLEDGEALPPLAFGSAHSVFYGSAEAALEAMKQQALVTAAMLTRLTSNIEKAKEIVATQKRVLEVEASYTGAAVGQVPMTGSFRAVMNQNKMLLETYAIGVSSWLSGIYLPKITACLMTANTRPQSRLKAQTLLAKLDALSAKLRDDEDEISEAMLDELDSAHAAVYAEIRRAGLTAALTKQMRGAFSSTQKREDHQHARFVTASLREELYYFIATGPMSVARRVTLNQYPLPRMLVAAERFLDADVCGTVDAFRAGCGHAYSLIPPDPMTGAAAFAYDQFDTGGSIQNITSKTLRVERTGSGVEEAEAALRAPGKLQSQRHGELEAEAWAELAEADASSLKLNVTDAERTNADRAEMREVATQRDRVSATEAADFVRSGNFVYVTDKSAAGAARSLKPIHARTSIHHGLHAPPVPGNVLIPSRSSWMDGTASSASMDAAVVSMMAKAGGGLVAAASGVFPAARSMPEDDGGAAASAGGAASAAVGEEEDLDISEKKRRRSVKFSDDVEAAPSEDEEPLIGADDKTVPPDVVAPLSALKGKKPRAKRARMASSSAAPASSAAGSRGRRMTRNLGVRDEGDEDAETAAAPSRVGGMRSQISVRDARHLHRLRNGDGQLFPPVCPPVHDESSILQGLESRIIPSLLSALPSMLPSVKEPAPHSLFNLAVISNLQNFANSAPLNSKILSGFIDSLRDTEPLLDGPALGDDEFADI
jgi:hypothetical protein